MDIGQQFQVFLGSIVLGMLFLCLWSLFNAFFYKLKKNIIRLPFETILFISLAYLYHLFLVAICDGVLNVFYPLAILIGCIIYQKFYSPRITPYFNKFVNKLLNSIKSLYKRMKNFYNKIKPKRRKKHANKKNA